MCLQAGGAAARPSTVNSETGRPSLLLLLLDYIRLVPSFCIEKERHLLGTRWNYTMESRSFVQLQMETNFFNVHKFKLSLYRANRQCSVCKTIVLHIRTFLCKMLPQIPAKSKFVSRKLRSDQ